MALVPDEDQNNGPMNIDSAIPNTADGAVPQQASEEERVGHPATRPPMYHHRILDDAAPPRPRVTSRSEYVPWSPINVPQHAPSNSANPEQTVSTPLPPGGTVPPPFLIDSPNSRPREPRPADHLPAMLPSGWVDGSHCNDCGVAYLRQRFQQVGQQQGLVQANTQTNGQ